MPTMPVRSRIRAAWLMLAFGASACASDGLVQAFSPSTAHLLVTNGTCVNGTCTPLQVYAFPSNSPAVPAGPWHFAIGTVTGPSACLSIPARQIFVVGEVSSTGTVISADTTVWTTLLPAALGSAPPSPTGLQANSSTTTFTPAQSAGWSITLPGSAAPAPAAVCSP